MHILIADDHAVVRRGLREIMADALPGAAFSEAGNGDEVLSHLGKSQIAMLVLDINMPFMTGLEVLSRIRRDAGGHRVKVLLLTASGELKDVQEGLALGADDYVAKPFSPAVLVQRIKALLASPSEPP